MKQFILIFLILQAGFVSAEPLPFGNPSNATTDLNNFNNYLVIHKNYALSYNKERGAANWVAWSLTESDIGQMLRDNAFAVDIALPREWRIKREDYAKSGYDMGHLCSPLSRSSNLANLRETYLISNMQPQIGRLNRVVWQQLESFEVRLTRQSDAYIYAGCYGDQGRIKDKITIPTNCWKVIVLLPKGQTGPTGVTRDTQIIAVDMPNNNFVNIPWQSYLTTASTIERKTGFDFLSKVPQKVQEVIESKIYR